MKASDLNLVFFGKDNGAGLRSSIHAEVVNYESLLKKVGSSIPLILHEDEDIVVDNKSLRKLLSAVICGTLDSVDVAYICDCLTLAERVKFGSEHIQDIVFGLADPEINGGFSSTEQIESLLGRIDETDET